MAQAADDGPSYAATTRAVRITVTPFYLADQSSPDNHHFVFAYQIRIDNQRQDTVQLRSRYWRITDGNGRVQEVRGVGVVGEQPRLAPGESFEYTSGTPLATASGIMVGTYQMVTDAGEPFEVAIPAFSLDAPDAGRRLN
ncbi:MAG TPA: Co2+/Mg2+ efflux protein ApaG [Alphaproteobacteria bacterium]